VATSVSNECFIVGPERDLLEVFTLLKESYKQKDVVFLLNGQLRWRCQSTNGPAVKYFEDLSLRFPKTTLGWWCWAEWGAYHGCQILSAGVAEWEQYGREEYCDGDDCEDANQIEESTELSGVALYTQTIELFMNSSMFLLGSKHEIIGDGDIAEEPEGENGYEL
jgi:hypothetical protein